MKIIPDTDNRYAVTDKGGVWDNLKLRFITQGYSGQGRYLTVNIVLLGKSVKKYVHRLVAFAYIENPENKRTVNHKNGVKTDNNLSNLEWATHKEQLTHAIATGLHKVSGEENPMCKLTESLVEEIRLRYLNDSMTTQDSLAIEYGVCRVLIKKIVTGMIWKHTWKAEYSRPPRWKDTGLHRRGTKFTIELAETIRAKYLAGGCTTRSLGLEFKIDSSTIHGIVNNTKWIV